MSKALQTLPAWGISLFFNLAILAIFHFVVFDPTLHKMEEVVVMDSIVEESPVQPEEIHISETMRVENVGSSSGAGVLSASMQSATSLGTSQVPLQEQVQQILNPQLSTLTETSFVRIQGDVTQQVAIQGGSDDVSNGVEGAMDRIAFEIRQSLRDRKTMVIWLFDASGSLDRRRTQVADRFDNIYRQLGQTGATDGLYSAIVSYGERAELLTPEPMQDVIALSDIVRQKIKTDESGRENVFGTVKMVLDKLPSWRRSEGPWNQMIVIVTDERGDDAEQYLDEVISQAKRTQTKVYTIGNAAIFGRKEGYVRWEDPSDGFVAWRPVDQGPETAFPEGVQLPFIGSGEDWRLRQMSSSYGPYALTRLSAETGGLFLITEGSSGHSFDRLVMRRYEPDYRPFPAQWSEISKHPAKSALVSVAGLTYDDQLPLPQMEFRGYNDNILRRDLTEAQRPAAEVDFALKRMYDMLSAGESARAKLTEERWRAAFDLAMGRIMAMRVRYVGYNQMLANMKVNPQPFQYPNSNWWRLVPSDAIESGPQMRKAAEQAKEYLSRVVNEHPGTPWAMLAERELQHDLGWSWREFSRPIPGSDRLRASDQEVARLLLADEQRRQSQQRRQEKPRNLPNF